MPSARNAGQRLKESGRVNLVKIGEIMGKSILSRSQVYDYALNPYVGCQHGCVYCYARFMKRFTGHMEKWGEFVDVKINAPELLAREVKKKRVAGSGSAACAILINLWKRSICSRRGVLAFSWKQAGR
jgi:hypothetical protein